MITLETQITGGQLGGRLVDDPEETWQMLMEMADGHADDFPNEVAEYAYGESATEVVAFLRIMADRIEEARS